MLKLSGVDGALLARAAIHTQLRGYISLGSCLVLEPKAHTKHDGHRKTALRWWRDFIKALEEE